MKSYIVLPVLAALSVDAQGLLGGLFGGAAASDDPYAYTAGDPLRDNYDALTLFDKTPPWPTNFGGAAIAKGPAPGGCSPFEIIVARGTSEPGPFGAIVGDPVVARVQQDLGAAQVRGYAVQYDATMVSFVSSSGPDDIANRIRNKATECPNMKYAVVGYSQGGSVVAAGLGKVPQNLRNKILAVVLYAPFGGAAAPADYNDRTLQNCATGDPVCLNGIDQTMHISYNTKGTKWHEASRKFIDAAFQGRPLAANPGKPWTAAWLRTL